jgi:hypothetical protein
LREKIIFLILFQKIIFLFVFGIAMYETAGLSKYHTKRSAQADILSLINGFVGKNGSKIFGQIAKELGNRGININNNQNSDDRSDQQPGWLSI